MYPNLTKARTLLGLLKLEHTDIITTMRFAYSIVANKKKAVDVLPLVLANTSKIKAKENSISIVDLISNNNVTDPLIGN